MTSAMIAVITDNGRQAHNTRWSASVMNGKPLLPDNMGAIKAEGVAV